MGFWHILVPEQTVNYIVDPSFEYNTTSGWGTSTGGTYWTVVTGGTGSVTALSTQSCWGPKSVLLVPATSIGTQLYQSVTMTTASWTLSCYVQRSTGGAPTSTDIQAIIGATTGDFDSFTLEANNWYRAVKTVTGTAGAANIGIKGATGGLQCYIDGVQFE